MHLIKKSYSSFAELLKDIEDIYEEIERSEEDIVAGRTISGNEALKELREKYGL